MEQRRLQVVLDWSISLGHHPWSSDQMMKNNIGMEEDIKELYYRCK
jgi:hypothetical protein